MSARLRNHERTTEIAYYLAGLLDSLHLPSTASTLRRQAHLDFTPNIQEDIHKIRTESHYDQPKQKLLISLYFTRCLKKLLREGLVEEALWLFQNQLPLYVDDLDPFSLLFAGSHEQEDQRKSEMIAHLLRKTTVIPYRRVSSLEMDKAIKFIEVIGREIVVIDHVSTAKVIREGAVVAERKSLHQSAVTCIAAGRAGRFATGGEDKICRLWNSHLELLYELSRHNSPLSAICLRDSRMATFDRQGTLISSSGAIIAATGNPAPAIKNGLPFFKMQTIVYIGVESLRRRDSMLGAGNLSGRGRLDLVDFERRECRTKLSLCQQIYAVEMSAKTELVFLSLNTNKICGYSTSTYELSFTLQSHHHDPSSIRMAVGGNNHDILAFGNQAGIISLSSIRKRELIGKLRGASGKSINCLRWAQGSLWTGCEAGWLQEWGDVESGWIKASKEEGGNGEVEDDIDSADGGTSPSWKSEKSSAGP